MRWTLSTACRVKTLEGTVWRLEGTVWCGLLEEEQERCRLVTNRPNEMDPDFQEY